MITHPTSEELSSSAGNQTKAMTLARHRFCFTCDAPFGLLNGRECAVLSWQRRWRTCSKNGCLQPANVFFFLQSPSHTRADKKLSLESNSLVF